MNPALALAIIAATMYTIHYIAERALKLLIDFSVWAAKNAPDHVDKS